MFNGPFNIFYKSSLSQFERRFRCRESFADHVLGQRQRRGSANEIDNRPQFRKRNRSDCGVESFLLWAIRSLRWVYKWRSMLLGSCIALCVKELDCLLYTLHPRSIHVYLVAHARLAHAPFLLPLADPRPFLHNFISHFRSLTL